MRYDEFCNAILSDINPTLPPPLPACPMSLDTPYISDIWDIDIHINIYPYIPRIYPYSMYWRRHACPASPTVMPIYADDGHIDKTWSMLKSWCHAHCYYWQTDILTTSDMSVCLSDIIPRKQPNTFEVRNIVSLYVHIMQNTKFHIVKNTIHITIAFIMIWVLICLSLKNFNKN